MRIYRNGFAFVLFLSLILSSLNSWVWAIQMPAWDNSQEPSVSSPQDETYQAGVSVTKFLPPEMYGVWSIQAHVLETDNPALAAVSTEIWALARDRNTVTIQNVVNQAQATIHVDKVQGNTATFHRAYKSPDERFEIIETPTVTVDGNFLTGQNIQVYRYFRNGKITLEHHVKAEIHGTRLANQSYRFKQPQTPPDFDVPDIKIQR